MYWKEELEVSQREFVLRQEATEETRDIHYNHLCKLA